MPPVTVSEVYDAVMTTTLRNMQPTIHDEVTRSNKVVAYLDMRGRTRRVNGGERIKVPLMYGLNNTADIYQGYGILANTPQDGITAAFFPWSQLDVSIVISGLEEMQNRGEAAVLDLLRAKTTQSSNSLKQLLNNCVVMGRLPATGNLNQFFARVGKVDSGALGPLPLPVLIDANPARSVSIGEINGATDTWWQNQARAFSGTTFKSYLQQKNRLYNDCSKGILGHPDLIVSDQLTWELYWSSLEHKERYIINDQRTIDVLGGAQEDMLKFRGAVHIWDEVVPDVGTSTAIPETEVGAGDGVGTYGVAGTNGTEYFLNSEAMEYIVHTARDMVTTPFLKPVNQDARMAHILHMCQVTITNRRKLGVMYDIDTSIAA